MRHGYRIAAAMALILGVAWYSETSRAQQQGVGEKVGEKLDQAGRKLKKGLNKAEDAVRESFHKSREAILNMGVQARVYGRIHWDKALHGSDVHVKVEEGVVTLTGAAPTSEARTKAVTLAAETVGVAKVVDKMTIRAVQTTRPRPRKP